MRKIDFYVAVKMEVIGLKIGQLPLKVNYLRVPVAKKGGHNRPPCKFRYPGATPEWADLQNRHC